MLTQEQWDALTPEEQEKRQSEKPSPAPEVKEDVVIINGVARPLKNFIAEISRKTKEDVLAEINAQPPKPTPAPVAQGDWQKQIATMAEREMEETGNMLPVNTILTLINQGTQHHIKNYTTTTNQANKVIKETKKELKSAYKDYGDYEDEFEEIIETIEPQNVSKDGLKIIFNSLRGKKLDDILKREREEAARKAEENPIVIGDLARGSAGGGNKPMKLTAEQQKEMSDMGFETEEDYTGRLKKYQSVAKKNGAKNTPQLLSERLTY